MTEAHGRPSVGPAPGRSLLLPSAGDLAAPLPATTDVAVIGGGLAGCALAYYVARSGVDVVVLERGELNREASGTNSGSFHFQIAIHQLTGSDLGPDRDRLLADVRLHAAAAAVWSELEAELGADLGVHVTGGLMVAETAEELAVLVAKQQIEKDAGLETEVLTGAALRDFAPFLAEDLTGGTYCGREGHANPLLAAPAFAARAIEAGARFRTHAAVTSIADIDGPGALRFKLVTAAGPIEACRVVNAAGAWAGDVAAMTGFTSAVAGRRAARQRHRTPRADAHAYGAAHRPAPDPEANRQRDLHHRRGLARPALRRRRSAIRCGGPVPLVTPPLR